MHFIKTLAGVETEEDAILFNRELVEIQNVFKEGKFHTLITKIRSSPLNNKISLVK
jgi:hypothetical protein